MDINQKRNSSCWRKRTSLEKGFMVVLIITAVLVILLSLKLFIKFPYAADENANICLTETCIKSASYILNNVDFKTNPCDDFYKFTCGNFLREAVIPDDERSIKPNNKHIEHTNEVLRQIVDSPQKDSDPKYLKLIKTIFSTCMDTKRVEEETIPFLKNLLKNLGGWPVLDGATWNEAEFNWQVLLYRLRKLGMSYNIFFQMYVGTDKRNTTRPILQIKQTHLYYKFKKGRNDPWMKATYEYMVDIAKGFGASEERARSDMNDIMELQMRLANITTEESRNASGEYNIMKIKELEGNFSEIPWLYFINSYLSPVERLTSEDYVNLAQPSFMQNLQELIASTRKRTIANYMFWKAIIQLERAFPEALRKKTDQYYEEAYGDKAHNKRWLDCFVEISTLNVGLSALYVKATSSVDVNTKATELVANVKEAFLDTLRKTTWMDKKTKKHALQKAEKMSAIVGFKNELLNDKLVDELYSSLFLHPESRFVEIILKLFSWSHMESVKQLNEPIVENDWKGSFTFATKAYYFATRNAIEISSATLEDSYFNVQLPQYLNYGAIGNIIGHEMTLAFDEIGRQYDKDGNLVDWWEPETQKAFSAKTQCFVEQYGNVTVPEVEMNLNGTTTLQENIADNGGIKIAYRGYQKWLERNPPEKSLPGLPYTPQQMFWISAATSHCVKWKKSTLKTMIETSAHTPGRYRVIIPFMNSDFFARDFNCPLGTAMNPKYKCRVW